MSQNPSPETPEQGMPFWDHLTELRACLFKVALAVFGGSAIGLYFSKPIFRALRGPYDKAFETVFHTTPTLLAISPLESFMVYLRVGILAGLFMASPMIFYQLWKFIAPALHEHERKHVFPFVFLSTLFFVGGALFGYYGVFPQSFEFLLGYGVGENIETKIRMEEYFYFASLMLLGFGAAFELPLLCMYLVWYRVISYVHLLKYWRAIVVFIFVMSMVLTPDTSIVSMLMMAAPLLILYVVTIALAYVIHRKDRAKLNG